MKLLLIKGVKSPRRKKFLRICFYFFSLFKRRFSESLGKSNGKKWSKIWNFLLINGVKSPRAKKNCFFLANYALLAGFFWYRRYYPHWSRDALSPVCRIFLVHPKLESFFYNITWLLWYILNNEFIGTYFGYLNNKHITVFVIPFSHILSKSKYYIFIDLCISGIRVYQTTQKSVLNHFL